MGIVNLIKGTNYKFGENHQKPTFDFVSTLTPMLAFLWLYSAATDAFDFVPCVEEVAVRV